MKRFWLAVTLSMFAALPGPSETRAQIISDATDSTVLVFDVSNSMWGQIDGVAKIEIAREVIGNLLTDWNPSTDLGMVAYGHRRTGDCSDIELVIPVGPVNAASFSQMVNSLVPRGKTPLTDAVRHAAEILNYSDTRATVILVSDGIESCNADPCALARELERGGIGFTAHVVGFDVSKIEDQSQLSCLAEETGGRYLTADNAAELLNALQSVAAPPPPAPVLYIQAAEAENGPALTDPSVRWTLIDMSNENTLINGENMAEVALETGAGRYLARAEINGGSGTAEFNYAAESDARITVVIEYAALATLDAPESVPAGGVFEVTWTGPDVDGDQVLIIDPDRREGAAGNYAWTRDGDPAQIRAYDRPGTYELRYVSRADRSTLATRPIIVAPTPASLSALPEIPAGAFADVTWQGPDNQNDRVNIVAVGEKEGEFGTYAYTRNGNPLEVRMPDQPGAYEFRYLSGQDRLTLAVLPVTVTPVSATLEAADTAGAGAHLDVTWEGPDNQNDFITIVAVNAKDDDYGNYTYTRNGNPLELRMPDEPGDYELRYMHGQSRTPLSRRPITVGTVSAELQASPNAGAGSHLEVTWHGPDNHNDFITVVPAGTKEGEFDNYTYTRNGSPLEVRIPDEPGQYELRYVTQQTRATLGRLPLTVTAVSASLQAVAEIGAGAHLDVTWQGPDNHNDFITIVPAGTKDGEFDNYTYTRRGSPLELRVPDAPGDYELRYVTQQTRATLAMIPVTVTEVSANLTAVAETGAGSTIDVNWEGPDNQNDFITIVPVGTKEGEFENYTYTRRGSPLELRIPDEPGAYELRYVTQQSRATLGRTPITVTPVTASLETAATVGAGGSLTVNWEGPDNHNDFITIVPAGTKEGEFGNYTYTRRGNPLELKVPEEPGDYEVRYLMHQSRRSLASVPVSVN